MRKVNLEVKNLVKKYGDFTAVNKLSFLINEKEIYALLGPNGAGKTSTFESIEGLIPVTSGSIYVDGNKRKGKSKIDKNIGVQLQDSAFQKNMKVMEIIKLVSLYYECKVNQELFKRMQMQELANKKISDLSVGQRRRVSLYLAFMHNPKIIILDEPTAGLDVIAKNEIYDILREFKDKGVSILISSHDMGEIERLADRIGVIVKGQLLKEASALEMTSTNQETKKIILKTKKNARSYEKDMEAFIVRREKSAEGYLIIYVMNLQESVSHLMKAIEKNRDVILDMRIEQPSLEEVFMKMTKYA